MKGFGAFLIDEIPAKGISSDPRFLLARITAYFFLNCWNRNTKIKKKNASHNVVVQLKLRLIPKTRLPILETTKYNAVASKE
jgi:hypothetical protein